MRCLNAEQVNVIAEEMNANEITYSHLQSDLLDHVCTNVETLMNDEDLSFREAFLQVKNKIGKYGLKEIQETTILYVKLNFLIMKKTINVLAIISLVTIITGTIFKVLHIAGGSIVYLLGMLTAFLGFLPTALMGIKKEFKLKVFSFDFLKYAIGFIALLSTGAAMLFTMMHWPGGRILTLISWILMFCGFFPVLFISILKSEKNRPLYLSLGLFSFLFFSWLVASGLNQSSDKYQSLSYINTTYELNYYIKQNEIISDNHPELSELYRKKKEVESVITSYQSLFLNSEQNIFDVIGNFSHQAAINIEYDHNLEGLRTVLLDYCDISLSFCSNNDSLEQLIHNKLDTKSRDVEFIGQTDWIKRLFFGDRSRIAFYTSLNNLHKDINQVFYEIGNNLPQRSPEL